MERPNILQLLSVSSFHHLLLHHTIEVIKGPFNDLNSLPTMNGSPCLHHRFPPFHPSYPASCLLLLPAMIGWSLSEEMDHIVGIFLWCHVGHRSVFHWQSRSSHNRDSSFFSALLFAVYFINFLHGRNTCFTWSQPPLLTSFYQGISFTFFPLANDLQYIPFGILLLNVFCIGGLLPLI